MLGTVGIVGYGLQGVLKPLFSDDFARYRTTVRLIELNSSFNGPGASAKFTDNPGGVTGGTCFEDSGGPIFYQDTPIIGAGDWRRRDLRGTLAGTIQL